MSQVKAMFFLAKSKDGRNVLYDVNVKIKEGVAADEIATSERSGKDRKAGGQIHKTFGDIVSQR